MHIVAHQTDDARAILLRRHAGTHAAEFIFLPEARADTEM